MKRDWLPILSIVALLAACGQTGPLYLPKEQPPAEQKAAAATAKEPDKQSNAAEADEEERTDADESGVELRRMNQ